MAKEVKRIMSPLPTVSYNPKSRSFVSSSIYSAIPRKTKRKSKFAAANEKYGECSKKAKIGSTFQKKLAVFGYMGSDAPTHFTRKDSNIVMRGLLPDISVDASEDDVRKEICEVIRGCNEHDACLCTPQDFEFINMSGKHASIPNVKSGYEFTGKAVKNLAGSGCVYVRMTAELFSTYVSSDEHSPKSMVKSEQDDDYLEHEYDLPSPSNILVNTPGFSRANEPNVHHGSSPNEPNVQNELDVDINKLFEVFPQVPRDVITFLYTECANDVSKLMSYMLEGLGLDTIRSILKSSRILRVGCDSPRIRLESDDDEDDWVSAAIAHYKSPKFDSGAEVRITIKGQPAVDTGGVRRQFFSVVLQKLAMSRMYMLFDGPIDRLRPSFKMANLSSGLLKIVGKMIGHSFVLDGQGFPYLSECVYYSLAGMADKAITLISEDDLSAQVKSLVNEVCRKKTVCVISV